MKKWVVVLSLSLLFAASNASAGTITSVSSGNWNSPSVWSTGVVPALNDDVVIGQGTAVILNVNSPAIRTITIQAGATLQGDGTGKILLVGKGGGEDFTNNGTFDATGIHAATIQLSRPMQWGGTGTYNCSFIDLSFRNLTFTAGTTVTVHVSGSPDPFLNPGGVVPSSSVTIDYNGSAAQIISATAGVGFNAINISTPAGVTLQKNLTSANLTGNVTINNGAVLNTSNGTSVFSITGGAGNAFAMAANALLVVGSTAAAAGSFPAGFSTYALDEASTVQYNNVSALTQNVSLTPIYGNLILSGSGTLSLGSGTLTLAGNWTNNASGTIQFSGSNVVAMSNGTSAHTIAGSSPTSFQGLTVNSAPGVSLSLSTTVAGSLALANGVVTTGATTLTVGAAGSVSRTSGYVNGRLVRYVPAGSPSLTFDIGDSSNYTPVTLSFAGVTTPANLTAQTFAGDQPNLSSSLIDGGRSVNRYWRLRGSGLAFSSATGTFSFAPGDVDGNADPSSFIAGVYNGSAWTALTPGTRTATSTEVTGIGTFGDFALGDLIAHTITATAGANGTISPSGSVPVTHGANQSFTITPNTGYHIAGVSVDGVSQGAVSTYQFSNVTANHTIDASFAINTYTITASSDANGTVTPPGVQAYDYGANQTYTFTPNTGYHVANVLVDSSSVGAVNNYAFNGISGNHTISVSFALNQFTISASSGPNGTISPSGTVMVDSGSSQAFNFTPATGYHVDSVVVDGSLILSAPGYTFSDVAANHTIHVAFAIDQYTITASAGANGSIAPSGTVVVQYNSSQLFTFTPAPNYHVDSLVVDGVDQAATPSFTFNNVTANHTIHVTFAVDQYTITASAGANGSISPSGVVGVSQGDTQGFSFTPAAGYHVDSLIVDGVRQPSAPTYTFADITANHTIHVTFAINHFTIDASAGPNGSITPSGAVDVTYGSSQEFTFTPAANHHVDSVIVDGTNQPTGSTHTFTDITANHTIRVTFAIDEFAITAGAGLHGTISPSGAVQVAYGASQTFTFTPDTGYYVSSLHVDSAAVAPASQYTFVNVTANHTIDVQFAPETFTIHATSGLHGSISPSGTVVVDFGASQTFTFTPDTGYYVATLHVDTLAIPAASQYTFTNVRANHAIDVQFALQYFIITASAGPHGTINPSGAVALSYGASQNFIMTPDSGWVVAEVVVDSASVGAVNSYKFENVIRTHTISASFEMMNHPPAPPLLVMPLNRDTINVDSIPSPFLFGWRRSADPDTGDTVRYALHLFGSSLDTTIAGLADTVVGAEVGATLHAGSTYYWTVSATDGRVTVASADTFAFTITFASGVKGRLDRMPKVFALYQNYPNPFNPTTNIEYDVPHPAVVTMKIYNILGAEVATLVDHRAMERGAYVATFDGSNLASGIYFYRIEAKAANGEGFVHVKKLMLLK